MKYFLLFVLLFVPGVVDAAALYVEGEPSTLRVGETSTITVTLRTEGEIINAVEGSLSLPETLTVRAVRFTGSVVPLWLEEPHEVGAGTLSFAAVLPGGYQNGGAEASIRGNVFTVVVEAVEEGQGRIALINASAYLNDGEGTQTPLAREAVTVLVSGDGGTPQELPVDAVPPEALTVEVVPGETLGLPDRALVFFAQDKDSSIEGYEVARSFFPLPSLLLMFSPVESPMELTALDSLQLVTVRASDAYGNTRAMTVAPGGVLGYLPTFLLVILILSLLIIYRRRIRAIIKR